MRDPSKRDMRKGRRRGVEEGRGDRRRESVTGKNKRPSPEISRVLRRGRGIRGWVTVCRWRETVVSRLIRRRIMGSGCGGNSMVRFGRLEREGSTVNGGAYVNRWR